MKKKSTENISNPAYKRKIHFNESVDECHFDVSNKNASEQQRSQLKKDKYDSDFSSKRIKKRQSLASRCFWFFVKQMIILVFSAILIMLFLEITITADIDPQPAIIPRAPRLEGPLEINFRLSKSEKIFSNKFRGGESFIFLEDDSMIISIHNGSLLRVDKTGKQSIFVRFGAIGCKTTVTCGRPLGLRYIPESSQILAVDAYLGIFSIKLAWTLPSGSGSSIKIQEVKLESVQRLYPPDEIAGAKDNSVTSKWKVTFLNDVTVLPDGRLAITETSTRRPMHEAVKDFMEFIPSGRILIVDPRPSGPGRIPVRVFATDLPSPNGIQYDPKSKMLIWVEASRLRIVALPWNNETSSNNTDRLISPLPVVSCLMPGLPDNIRPSSVYPGTYWVGLGSIRHAEQFFDGLQLLASWPRLNKFIRKIASDPIIHMFSTTKHAILVRIAIDAENNRCHFIESLQDPTGKVMSISEAHERPNKENSERYLYIGSYFLPFMSRVSI